MEEGRSAWVWKQQEQMTRQMRKEDLPSGVFKERV
jgi:hypothetical protein